MFEPVAWDVALDDIAGRLRGIVDERGAQAVMPYSYLGTQGLVQGSAMSDAFFARLGATHLVRSVCGSAGGTGIAMTIGDGPGFLPEDLAHSRYIILWGTNTISTNLHLWPFIREAKEHGATIVAIDPAKTRTAAAADVHIRPMPGTDAALALGMMHVIVAEGLHDERYLSDHTVGFEELAQRLPEYAARARRHDHRDRRGPDPSARARVRDHAPGRDPPARGDGASRVRGVGVPRDQLPAGRRRGLARPRRRSVSHDVPALRGHRLVVRHLRSRGPLRPIGEHGAGRSRADRPVDGSAHRRAGRLQLEPGGDRAEPEPGARRSSPRGPVHRRARARADRHRAATPTTSCRPRRRSSITTCTGRGDRRT